MRKHGGYPPQDIRMHGGYPPQEMRIYRGYPPQEMRIYRGYPPQDMRKHGEYTHLKRSGSADETAALRSSGVALDTATTLVAT